MAKAIPEGFHSVTPSLFVDGCSEAIDWYKKALGASEIMRMAGPDGKIMHAEIKIGDSIIMMSDANPQWGTKSPKSLGGFSGSLYVYVKDADAAFKRAVDAGANVKHPVQDMFWGDRIGGFEDPFGHQWSVATHVKDVTPSEIAAAQQEWMEKMAGSKG